MNQGKRLLTVLLTVSMMAVAAVGPSAGPTQAVTARRVDLRLLVIHDGAGTSPSLDAWTALLTREGVPYDVHDSLAGSLIDSDLFESDHALYQGVVCATACSESLSATDLATLDSFTATFGIRRINAYVNAYPAFGLANGVGGAVGGDTLTLTPSGNAVFPYLDGPVPVDSFTYGYYATVVDPGAYEGLLVGPGGQPVMGIYQNPAGFEEIAFTVDTSQYQMHANMLGHGQLNWVTQGVYLGYSRNYFTAHIDDVFLPDDRWNVDTDTTPEGVNEIRMVPSDVTRAMAWQSSTGIRLDMVFNGAGSVEAGGAADPLTVALLGAKSSFYWINHTYEHLNLDSASQAVIESEIQSNLDFAATNSISIDVTELVTGEHSGLQNANMGPALTNKGIEWIAADSSRQPDPYSIGSAVTIPRFPANVYYNVGTEAEQLDEYNFIYSRTQNCIDTPVTTCNSGDVDWNFYVDSEANIMLPHLITNDPKPHYFHQSNIAEDGVFYTVFEEVLSRYNSAFSVPLLQPTFSETAQIMQRADAWDAVKDGVTAYTMNGAVFLSAPGAVSAPITGTSIGTVYGGHRSGWTIIDSSVTILDPVAPVISLVGDPVVEVSVGVAYSDAGATALDNVDGDITGTISVGGLPVDTSLPGEHTVTYDVADVAGNSAIQVTRTVKVVPWRGIFSDDDDSLFELDIEWLWAEGITAGCGLHIFCPDDGVARGEMAAFLRRSLDTVLTVDLANAETFVDTTESLFEADITWLSAAEITVGCGADTFCPNDGVNRGEMAAFLMRAFGSLIPEPAPTGTTFVDTADSLFEIEIQWLSDTGITKGCGPDRFCPDDDVTRGEMAAFIRRAFAAAGL